MLSLSSGATLAIIGAGTYAAVRPILAEYASGTAPSRAEVSAGVINWWATLCAIALVNICAWLLLARDVLKKDTTGRRTKSADVADQQQTQLLLSGLYTFGCAFRSVLPRADVQRMCLFDGDWSTVAVGRSVATVAEVAFVAQWAVLLGALSQQAKMPWLRTIASLLVPTIVVAEVCSWVAVLSTNYMGNAIEESLWAVSALLAVVCTAALWSRCSGRLRPYLGVAIVGGLIYIAFMCLVDVPMYLSRHKQDEASGREYLTLWQGVRDVRRRVVSYSWDEWETEMPWMTLYFSFAVWFSMSLVKAPRFDSAQAALVASKKRD